MTNCTCRGRKGSIALPCVTYLGANGQKLCKANCSWDFVYATGGCGSTNCGGNCTGTSNCGPCVLPIVAINPEISRNDIVLEKNKITFNAILKLKQTTIWSDFTENDFFKEPTQEQYTQYFQKLSGSALTLVQQKLLLEQITTDFTQENALNLFMNSRNSISRGTPTTIDSELLRKIIKETIHNVITNIMLSYQFQDSFLHFNYAGAYQSTYYASSLYLYKYKWDIIFYVSKKYLKNVK